MYRGTTPKIIFTLDTTLNLTYIKEVWATFKSGQVYVTKDINDATIDDTAKTISFTLTQADTLSFTSSKVNTQLRLLLNDGNALATPITSIEINKVLKEGEIYVKQ